MVLETQIQPFFEWLSKNGPVYLLLMLGLAVFALFVGFLLSAVRNGPGGAFRQVGRLISGGITDLKNLSLRRIFAMAKLAVQESLRRYVLVVFAVFAVIMMFAGWYLDVDSDNPGPLYISFVLKTTNFLVILLAIFLSAFSLPNDMKNKTIFTVVTKPVRPWEIIIGRILGFAIVGTAILAMMCFVSYFFVKRGLDHKHTVEAASVSPLDDRAGLQGRTTFESHHRHDLTTDEKKRGVTEAVKGHSHRVLVKGDDQIEVGPVNGALEARVPMYGDLRFLDRKGNPGKPINIGKEWTYRGYIEGGTLCAGIWRFKELKSRDFLNGLPLEMKIRVFRTYQGNIEKGILGSMEFRNPNPDVHSKDPAVLAKLDPDTAVKSRAINFIAQDHTPESRTVDRRIECQMIDGSYRTVDLFEALTHNGELEVWVRCNERSQYFGMAKTDLYLRAADKMFWWNFVKSYITLWLQMLIVTSFGVMFSTFLTGSVAMLATLASMVMGYFSQSIVRVATGEAEGGGPYEALIRIFKQQNLTTELEGSQVANGIIKGLDSVTMFIMRGVSYLMPNFRDFAEFGGMNTARFVAYGFDIPGCLMGQHVLMTMVYITLVTCIGYAFLKTKEIAA